MRLPNAAWLLATAALAPLACVDSPARTSGDGDGGEGDVPPQDGICGDGLVNAEQEACDDANVREGDGCNSDCRASGNRVWCLDDFGPADVDALPRALAVGPSGDVAVLGTLYQGGSATAWLEVVDATGAPRWSTRFEGATGTEVEFSSAGTLAVATYELDAARSRITLFSAEGTAGTSWTGEADPPVWLGAFVMSPRDRIIAAGGAAAEPDEVWIGTFSPSLALEQQATYRSSQGISTEARAVAYARAETIILGADVVLGPGTDSTSPPTTVAIAALLPSGELAWEHVFESPNRSIHLASLAAMVDGSVVATGGAGLNLTFDVWTASLSAAGDVNWEITEESPHSPNGGTSVVPTSTSDFVLTRFVSREATYELEAVFGRYDHEHAPLWEREYERPGRPASAQLAAKSSADLSFLLAGFLNPAVTDGPHRPWLCKYTE